VLHDWFRLIQNDLGHTCFNSVLLTAEIIYYSRCFEIQTNDEGMQIVSKSRGVVPFFSFKDFQNKFNLSYAQIKSAIDLIVKKNLVNLDVIKTKYRRRVQKKTFYTANFEKLALRSKLSFKFKTLRQLNKNELSIFLNFYTPYTYTRKYSISYTNIWLNNRLNVCDFADDSRYTSRFRKFKEPKTLDQIPKSYLDQFEYLDEDRFSKSFLKHLLNKLADKYPHLMFRSKRGFESYFRRMLYQESSNKTGPKYHYLAKPISLKMLANNRSLKRKLKGLIDPNRSKQTMQILAKLAKKDLMCTFSTLESVASYLQKALEHEQSPNQVKRIFNGLPKVHFQQMEKYLDSLEVVKGTSYSKHPSLVEKFRSRIAAKLPRRTAYYLLTSMKMFKVQTEGDKFIIPTLNKEYCDMLPRYIKQTIINELQAVYRDQNLYSYESSEIRNLKFVHAHVLERDIAI